MFKKSLLAATFFISVFVNSQHIAKLELVEIEWNGKIKAYKTIKKFEEKFGAESKTLVIDTIDGHALFGKFIYQPVFNDTGLRPAFNFLIFDSTKPHLDLSTLTDYKSGKYDAGIKLKDQFGLRRWVGKLKYTPDTSIHIARPEWRQDNFTLQIETFQAWNAETDLKRNGNNKVIKDLYFQGVTGAKSDLKSGGRYGDENFYIQIDPIRYQWGSTVWTEILVHLYKKQENGQLIEVLAHAFKSTDKNIFYNGVRKQNAYEVRDAKDKYYMMFTGVLIIPY